MKKFKLEITINEKDCSTTTTSCHFENEIMNNIVESAIKSCGATLQKYIIVLAGGKDNGNAKLSAYNEKMLKKPINVVLEECFKKCGGENIKNLNTNAE